jgi:hypothetical protein
MTLSKRDYEAIAKAIATQVPDILPQQRQGIGGFPELQTGPRLIGKDLNGVWWATRGDGDECGFATKALAVGWMNATPAPFEAVALADVWCSCADADPVPYQGDGPLGHGFDCARCGKLIQVG